MATFSRKTWLEDIIVDSCQASFRGGAFAFLQAPAAAYGTDCFGSPNAGDDGRLARHLVPADSTDLADILDEELSRGSRHRIYLRAVAAAEALM